MITKWDILRVGGCNRSGKIKPSWASNLIRKRKLGERQIIRIENKANQIGLGDKQKYILGEAFRRTLLTSEGYREEKNQKESQVLTIEELRERHPERGQQK